MLVCWLPVLVAHHSMSLDPVEAAVMLSAGDSCICCVDTACRQSCELFTVALPDLQLAVTEQRVRSWAATAAQLQVQVTVSNTAALDATKKPGGPTASAKATTAAGGSVPAVATGTLLVNCAGLLVGDSTASYRWGKPLHAAPAAITPVAEAATSAAEVAVAPAGPASLMPAQAAAAVAAAAPAGQSRFKWSTQDPSGSLQSWLDSAEVEVQVIGFVTLLIRVWTLLAVANCRCWQHAAWPGHLQVQVSGVMQLTTPPCTIWCDSSSHVHAKAAFTHKPQ